MHSGWKTRPTYLATVALSESFEAAALEEYLIRRLNPAENAPDNLALKRFQEPLIASSDVFVLGFWRVLFDFYSAVWEEWLRLPVSRVLRFQQ